MRRKKIRFWIAVTYLLLLAIGGMTALALTGQWTALAWCGGSLVFLATMGAVTIVIEEWDK
jgi:hypothetical protein